MKRKGVIFSRLEKINKAKYPNFIKQILIENGFDTAAALRTLNKSVIENLEQIINEKTVYLKNKSYVDVDGQLKITPFKFKIGHETILLNLPKDLTDYLTQKNNTENEKISEIAIEDIKIAFVDKVVSFLSTKNISGSVSPEYLSAFTKQNKKIKCLIKCLYCSSKLNCFFDSCWRLSNYYKHIVACSKATVLATVIQPSIQPLTTGPRTKLTIQRAEHFSLREVQDLVEQVV